MKKNILITGCAGFIGFSVTKVLLQKGHKIYGVDNINNYYSVKLKKDRIKELYKINKNFKFYKIDISDEKKIFSLFKNLKIDKVLHLAAQAGVRYSLENPKTYIKSNLDGFFNILQCCKDFKVTKLVYASSSSVYGKTNKIPFKENQNTNNPEQLYAATKKSNELMAQSYSNLFNLNMTGLRYFTVYGPWGRPDMAIFSFVKDALENKKIDIFNKGNHHRDFTFIDDVADITVKILLSKKNSKNEIYNIGNNKPIKLSRLIYLIEKKLNLKIKKNFLPFQKGDVFKTYANINKTKKDFNYKPKENIETGLSKFIKWYKNYNNIFDEFK